MRGRRGAAALQPAATLAARTDGRALLGARLTDCAAASRIAGHVRGPY
ncbi:transcription elongation factor GreB-related protein [Mycobacterium intracellulare subsp. yongonense]|uniref:Uncharacterized protein n=3 Tax=Mycobacterium intracellulare TaxID=1767 RepID=X8CL50_MYCIT|nr:hypothetical protein OCU_04860 [Mycobacterium intracellulare ATCC 13950]AFS12626.1 Putative trmH family tRNA/rRNA methyl transferase yacO [Mycobacterium intracellulare subsp. intracellulare MTCC 9506]ARR76158.1 transcription elongation factor GreB-related protein [Mycobacterium intracellulare subsp. yongonense]ETZ34708.1 hypothetical protein L842_0481 [Mycobacterium intracellulare MIN_052511_1280]ETZ39244.1 hypothetical protein L843_0652 [Mycobacterium intracellulare MIN_061107_1834]EUA5711